VAVPQLIRRHTHPSWRLSADACDFRRDPPAQRTITQNDARPQAGRLRLLRPLPRNDKTDEARAPPSRFYSERREALAIPLLQLAEKAGLSEVPADGQVPDLGRQYRRLRAAAHTIELDVDVPLFACLCTHPPALPTFCERIADAPAARLERTQPHGIVLAIAAGVGRAKVLTISGEP
jgi:hypothetical protein